MGKTLGLREQSILAFKDFILKRYRSEFGTNEEPIGELFLYRSPSLFFSKDKQFLRLRGILDGKNIPIQDRYFTVVMYAIVYDSEILDLVCEPDYTFRLANWERYFTELHKRVRNGLNLLIRSILKSEDNFLDCVESCLSFLAEYPFMRQENPKDLNSFYKAFVGYTMKNIKVKYRQNIFTSSDYFELMFCVYASLIPDLKLNFSTCLFTKRSTGIRIMSYLKLGFTVEEVEQTIQEVQEWFTQETGEHLEGNEVLRLAYVYKTFKDGRLRPYDKN